MREYDDDSSIQHYAPVLRRIIILVAVITAVPVMLWTITAFMHTYIAQPTISAPRPLAAAASAAPASPAADTANPPAPSRPAQPVTDTKVTDDARGDRMRDSGGNTGAPNVQVAALQPTPSAASAASPAPAAVTVQAAPASAPSVFPDPPSVAPQQPAAPDSANDTSADALPPPDPITGPIPLPRHRPNVIALADTDIPLPRARPSDAPEPPSQTPDAPPSGYDPGIGH
jgi:hypothetical protein